jgi:curved DNA-binding protein CbpA
MVDLPDPIAEGDLERTPFAHVLAHVASKQITGSIVVWPAEGDGRTGQDRIRVEGGNIVAARLVERGPMLERALVPLFGRASGPYALYGDIDLVGDSGLAQRVDSYALIASALRSESRDDAVERVLGQLAEHTLRLRGAPELKRFAFLPKEERFVETMLAAPGTPDTLLRSCELGPVLGKRMLYMLYVSKFLEPYQSASARASLPGAARPAPAAAAPVEMRVSQLPIPPGGSASPAAASSSGGVSATTSSAGSLRAPLARMKETPALPPDPPASGLAPDQLAFWKEVIERTRAIDKQNYFDMLGVPRDAGADTIRKAYFALAKRWHPDRISGALLPIKPFVERVFGHITAAQDILADENRRGSYLRTVQDGGGTPEADRLMGAIVAAAMEHQKAEVLIRRRDFQGARAILEGAIELNAEEADALASLGWVLFNLPNEKTSSMLDYVDRAIKLAPKHDRAHYTRGMIQRRIGNEAEAIASFRAAGAANPKNLDAMREVRLADMRSGQPPTPGGAKRSAAQLARPDGTKPGDEPAAAEGGFLSKLFGSPKKK